MVNFELNEMLGIILSWTYTICKGGGRDNGNWNNLRLDGPLGSMPTYFWSFWTMKMMWIKSILLFSWSCNAPIHFLGVSRVLLVSSRDSHAATRDVFISLIDLCFFLSMCLLIDLIFNYTSMDHLFMINGKHNFTHFYWEILGDHYLLQGGGGTLGGWNGFRGGTKGGHS